MAGYSDDEFGIPGIPSGKTTGSPSKDAADQVKSGNTAALAYPYFFPGQGGLPIQLDDDEFNGDILPTDNGGRIRAAVAETSMHPHRGDGQEIPHPNAANQRT
jgi:hypothetical protein